MNARCTLLVLCLWLIAAAPAIAGPGRTRNVVLIVADGLRWQEVFSGADPQLLADGGAAGHGAALTALRARFWDEDPRVRRKLLFPFLWNTVATQGQLFGNQRAGSRVKVTNGVLISYPGYNEMLTGRADARIDRNEFGPNPNVSVLEWLNCLPDFHDRVDVFATWYAFADIFNEARSHLPVRAGATLVDRTDQSARGQLLAELYDKSTRLYGDNPFDAFVHVALREHLRSHQPRVLFVGYGDTDLWAHLGRYDAVLATAHSFDAYVGELWRRMQSLPQYRGRTTFILTADHGRGGGRDDWKEHGVGQPGSEDIWLAVIGPDTAPLGERHDAADLTQAQVAATVAALLGEDFQGARPGTAAPLGDALREPGGANAR
jgi:hypothetical protein